VLDKDAKHWIDKLHLQEHPEGGYFVETYGSEKLVNLPEYDGPRNAFSAIYYLLEGDQFLAFHKLKSDQLLHFYDGANCCS
jgi:predicted cupin superfamily sugar epimerase